MRESLAAGLSALLAGVSVGAAMLGIVVSLISLMGIVHNQYLFVPEYDPRTLGSIQALDPHIGWVLLMIAGVLLYLAVVPTPRYPGPVGDAQSQKRYAKLQ